MHAVKQDPETGAVAVQAGDNRWGVMNPANGGHWATDDEIKDWTDLSAAPKKAAAK